MMRFPFWVSTDTAHLPSGLLGIVTLVITIIAAGVIIWATVDTIREERRGKKKKREKGLRDEHR